MFAKKTVGFYKKKLPAKSLCRQPFTKTLSFHANPVAKPYLKPAHAQLTCCWAQPSAAKHPADV
ncbi:MAG: hypothetical protein KAR47_08525, partial [Planctomycetes bacterium]|nr:hypothetical protein [Planctomycetota bacterium]